MPITFQTQRCLIEIIFCTHSLTNTPTEYMLLLSVESINFIAIKLFFFDIQSYQKHDQRCYGNVPTQILVTTNFTQIIQTCECLCRLAKGVFTLIDATPIYYEAGTFGY